MTIHASVDQPKQGSSKVPAPSSKKEKTIHIYTTKYYIICIIFSIHSGKYAFHHFFNFFILR